MHRSELGDLIHQPSMYQLIRSLESRSPLGLSLLAELRASLRVRLRQLLGNVHYLLRQHLITQVNDC